MCWLCLLGFAQVKFHIIPWDKESGDEGMQQVMSAIKAAAAPVKTEEGEGEAGEAKVKVGMPIKDDSKGSFAEAWKKVCTDDEVSRVDISLPLGLLLAVKDEVRASHTHIYIHIRLAHRRRNDKRSRVFCKPPCRLCERVLPQPACPDFECVCVYVL